MLRLRDGELQTLGFMEKISRKKMKNREREREGFRFWVKWGKIPFLKQQD